MHSSINTSLRQVSIWVWLCLIGLFGLGYYYVSSHAFVKINVDTASPTVFQIFWKSSQDQSYSPDQATTIQIYPNKHFYTAFIGDLTHISHLRIDPTNGKELFRIKEISIYQAGLNPVRFMGKSLHDLKNLAHIGLKSFDESGMVFQPTTADPKFEATIEAKPENDNLWTHIWRIVVLFAVLALAVRSYPALTRDLSYVPPLMLSIVILLLTMASISRPNVHPDEHAHLQAARYYEDHSAPPAVCESDTLYTYTSYGTSRLNTNEAAYWIAGKYLQLTDIMPLKDYYRLRLFNIGLFMLLVLLAFARPASRIVLLPLLISPQFWYVFSYFNSDALAIFTGLMLAYQLVAPDSALRKLTQAQSARPVIAFTLLAVLASLSLLIKKNYYFFSLFLAGATLVWLWLQRKNLKSHLRQLKLIGGLSLAALAAFGGWTAYQESINGFDRGARVLECREQTAEHAFKPSTPLDEAAWSLSFDERGISIQEMLSKGWAKQVFMSAFGNFGYVAHPASRLHYQLVALLLLGLAVYILYRIARDGSAFQRWLLAGAISLLGMLVAITLYKSWTVDYQPQGRFYFPMIPVVGALLGWLSGKLNKQVLSIFVLLLFALGFYAFVSIGLVEIRKVGS